MELLNRLLEGLKVLAVYIVATKIERAQTEIKNLESQNEQKQKQAELAARPARRWSDLLERMRRNDL